MSTHEATPSPDNLYWLLAYFFDADSPHFSRRAVITSLDPELTSVSNFSQVGMLICGILRSSERSREDLDNAPKNLKCKLGTLLLSTDSEDVRLVCGVLMRIQAIHGNDLCSLWPSKTDQRARFNFPTNPESEWLIDFHDYVNEIADLVPNSYVFEIKGSRCMILSNLIALPRSLGPSRLQWIPKRLPPLTSTAGCQSCLVPAV